MMFFVVLFVILGIAYISLIDENRDSRCNMTYTIASIICTILAVVVFVIRHYM